MMNTIQDIYDAVLHSNEQTPVVLNGETRAYLDDAGCVILSTKCQEDKVMNKIAFLRYLRTTKL